MVFLDSVEKNIRENHVMSKRRKVTQEEYMVVSEGSSLLTILTNTIWNDQNVFLSLRHIRSSGKF